jgi:peptidoglycan/xylan/chitin deacetylase (PgdA/CDA1 family)
MADEVFNNAGEWKITLSHDPASGGNNWNNIIQAVPLIIDGLRFRGYYLLTLSELLVMRGGTPSPGKVYQDFATIP